MRVLRLAFLSSRVTRAILDGGQRGAINILGLVAIGAIDAKWKKQESMFLPR